MTGRTITLPTLDFGPVTLAEPAWCAGHTDHQPVHRVDLAHNGPVHSLAHDGGTLWTVFLTQRPLSPDPAARRIGLYVAVEDFEGRTFDPAGADALADSLFGHVRQLRTLADALAALIEGDRA